MDYNDWIEMLHDEWCEWKAHKRGAAPVTRLLLVASVGYVPRPARKPT
jgi:hypothetical protein